MADWYFFFTNHTSCKEWWFWQGTRLIVPPEWQ